MSLGVKTIYMYADNGKLRDIWATTLNESESDGQARIDVLAGLSRMSLDVIGLAGEISSPVDVTRPYYPYRD